MSSKNKYQYFGYVLPSDFNALEPITQTFEKFDGLENLILRINIKFDRSNFTAIADVYNPRIDIPTGRNAVQEIIYDIVDSISFNSAIGYLVIISHCIHLESKERTNFGPMNMGLRKHIEGIKSDLTPSEIIAITNHKKGFFLSLALRDIANAHRYPIKDLPFYCRRATESCMRFLLDFNDLDPNNQKEEPKGWKFLQDATGTSADEYIKIKKMAADLTRHGSNVEFNETQAIKMAVVAWDSVHSCLLKCREKLVIRDIKQ